MHGQIELAGYPPDELPDVRMEINDDPMGGYNIRVTTTNFKFTRKTSIRQTVCMKDMHGLHINGEKVARIYGEYYHLAAMPPNLRNIGHPE